MNEFTKVFICFAAEDRYNIAEPIVYHLKNYGVDVWYDREKMVLGDNRKEKNLIDGAEKCQYAILIISDNTVNSPCAMEEISIIKERYIKQQLVVFTILYELSPDNLPLNLQWVKELIFKETNNSSGTREICNHIVCKITCDTLNSYKNKKISDILNDMSLNIPLHIYRILQTYLHTDNGNLNARISLLYATYINIISGQFSNKSNTFMISKIFERLMSETRLNLNIDYRELWLLENSICILINEFYSQTNSRYVE